MMKTKQRVTFSLLLFSLISPFLAPASWAQGARGSGAGSGRGGEAGGGGDEYVAYFVRKARDLLVMPRFEEGHRAAMQRGFDRSRIITVAVLRYPNNEPVRDQEKMIAWSSPGLIQLKVGGVRHASEDSWEEAVRSRRQVYHIVAHELWLASGVREHGLPIDNNFRLSLGLYGLDEAYANNMGIAWDAFGVPRPKAAGEDDFGAPSSWYPVQYRNPPVEVPPPGFRPVMNPYRR